MGRRRYYVQDQQRTCAVAALRTVLALQFDVRVESEQVLEVLGTEADEPIREVGTFPQHLRAMIKGASRAFHVGRAWTMKTRLHGTLADLKREHARGRFPLVRIFCWEWEPSDEYHMLVALRVEASRVLVWDPGGSEGSRPQWYARRRFMKAWTDPEGATWYSVVNSTSAAE